VILKQGQYSKYLPFSFTEQGVAILSLVINQDKNIELVFSCFDELIEKQENPKPRKQIGLKKEGE
jgi:hypothetical protein